MRQGVGRSLSRGDTFLLVGCLGLSVVALLLPQRWALAFSGAVRSTALAPFVWMQRNAEEQRTVRVRLRAIESERDSLALAVRSTVLLQAENQQLRTLLGLRSSAAFRTKPAQVLRQTVPTDGRTLLLGAGRNAGITVGSPVVSSDGLLGLVVEVAAASSIAMTWAHPEFAVSAVTGDGSMTGIVRQVAGSDPGDPSLQLEGVPYRDSIPVGTQIVTSGLTGVYPKGLVIGTVVGVLRDELGWERVYRVRPTANPGYATHVMVILEPVDQPPLGAGR